MKLMSQCYYCRKFMWFAKESVFPVNNQKGMRTDIICKECRDEAWKQGPKKPKKPFQPVDRLANRNK